MDFETLMSKEIPTEEFIDAMNELYATPKGRADIRAYFLRDEPFTRCIGKPALKYLDGEIDWKEFVEMAKESSLDYYNETRNKEAFRHLAQVISTDKTMEKGIDY